MEYFFDNVDRCELLMAECKRWEGTPFVQGAAAPGQGVDCLRFVVAVLGTCGVPVDQLGELPPYSIHEGRHTEHTRLLAWLIDAEGAREHMQMIDRDDPVRCGDLLAVIQPGGLGAHHLALATGPALGWHCAQGVGVCRAYLPVLRVAGIWRLRDNFTDEEVPS